MGARKDRSACPLLFKEKESQYIIHQLAQLADVRIAASPSPLYDEHRELDGDRSQVRTTSNPWVVVLHPTPYRFRRRLHRKGDRESGEHMQVVELSQPANRIMHEGGRNKGALVAGWPTAFI